MKKKKILIVLADVGNGHRSAANALIESFNNLKLEHEIKAVDLFELADVQPFNSSNDTYSLVSKNYAVEEVNNFFFRLFNTKVGFKLFSQYTTALMYKECNKIIKDENPDLIISVHPIVSIIISSIKKRSNLKFKYVNVVTDLITLFRGWGDQEADLTFAPTEGAFKVLTDFGIDPRKIEYSFFPINPKLEKTRVNEEILGEVNFNNNLPIVTITGGGVGTDSLKKAIKIILKRRDLNLIVICGKSEALRLELVNKYKDEDNIYILGYVSNIQDYFQISDIIISKPGPATILEIQLFNKKSIITKPIGEQEKGNVDYALESKKFRYIGRNWELLNRSLDELLTDATVENSSNRSFREAEMIIEKALHLLD